MACFQLDVVYCTMVLRNQTAYTSSASRERPSVDDDALCSACTGYCTVPVWAGNLPELDGHQKNDTLLCCKLMCSTPSFLNVIPQTIACIDAPHPKICTVLFTWGVKIFYIYVHISLNAILPSGISASRRLSPYSAAPAGEKQAPVSCFTHLAVASTKPLSGSDILIEFNLLLSSVRVMSS